jgi:hypothetical protein
MRLRISVEKLSASACVFVVLAVSILGAGKAYAQVAGATLTGTVKDSSGAVIPNAQVVITDVDTGVIREVSSGSAGLYAGPNLLPGNYEIRVTAQGFRIQVQRGITLTVGSQQVLDITMQVGQITQTVEVTGEAPSVELTSSAISAEVSATTVRELPLNGRSWSDLAILQPGVSQIETHTGGANRGWGGEVSISGARPQQNNYRLDAISISDYANGGPGSILGGNLGVDAIQEFSVLTSNFPAEYGKSSGGVVNAISRSGTNSFHGSAYEFLRNSALDTRNVFDGPTVPPFRRNQFGVSAGAPIRKDRTFVFGDYEGIRQALSTTYTDTVPSLAARSGILNFSDPSKFPSYCAATSIPNQCMVTIDPTEQKYLPLFHLPMGALVGLGNIGNYTFPQNQIVSENFVTTRVDHRFSAKDTLAGSYLYDNTPETQPNITNNVTLGNTTKRQFAVVSEDHTFGPRMVNSVRFGYNRDRVDAGTYVGAINPVAADTSLGGFPGLTTPTFYVPGLTYTGGVGGMSSFLYRWNSYQGYDDAFFTRGLHSVKFGIAFERDQLFQVTNNQPTGEVHFGTLADFLTNRPSRVTGALPGFLTPRRLRQSIVAGYIQDDWRARPNLTINLGLRYEMSTVPTETQGKLTNLLQITDATPHLGDPYFSNPTLHNFEPRVGFSWDPFSNGKTALRGGFGMYDGLPLLYQQVSTNGVAYPFFELGGVSKGLPQGSFPTGAFATMVSPSTGLPPFLFDSHESKPHRNYVMQWNLNVQRQLSPNTAALIGFVGSHGVHQPFRSDDANIVLPIAQTSAGYVWPNPIASGNLLNSNPGIGAIRYMFWGGSSFYDALEMGITKKMSHGLQLQGSYTWGKSIDNDSGVIAGDTLANAIASLHWYNLRNTRALSDFDIRRTLVISGTWQIPSIGSMAGPAAWVANGWEIGGVFKVNDGVPFTPTFGTDGDPLGLGSTDPYDYPNRLSGSNCASLVNPGNPNNYIKTQCFAVPTAPSAAFYNQYCDPTQGDSSKLQCFNLLGNSGRNTIPGPGLLNLDVSLFKNNYVRKVSETFNVQFRAEVFNVLNHPNFETPVVPDHTDIFDSSGNATGSAGQLTSTTTSSRQIQFALKVIW